MADDFPSLLGKGKGKGKGYLSGKSKGRVAFSGKGKDFPSIGVGKKRKGPKDFPSISSGKAKGKSFTAFIHTKKRGGK